MHYVIHCLDHAGTVQKPLDNYEAHKAYLGVVNRPGFAGDQIVRVARPYRVCSGLHETRLLCFSGWDISDGLKQGEWVNATGSRDPTNVVEPIDPFEGFDLDLIHRAP